MRVVNVSPNRMLRMSGALGPLQQSGAAGSMTWAFKPEASGTAVELTYSVGGYARGGFETMAPSVDEVLSDQHSRLKAYVENPMRRPK